MQSTTSQPVFTIITSTLNVMATIERCVESVTAQTYHDYEFIVIDGASTDGTTEFLNSRKEFFSVLISEPDTGIYNAWNKALKHARGEWLLFLGADDILADEHVLADVAAFIRSHKAASGIVYGDVALVTKKTYEEREIIKVLPENIGERSKREMRTRLPCHSGIFHHKSLFLKYGCFDEAYRICADAKFMISALCIYKENALRMPRIIYKMSMGGVSSVIGLTAIKEENRMMKELHWSYPKFAIFSTYSKIYLKMLVKFFLGEKIAYYFVDFIRSIKGKARLWT